MLDTNVISALRETRTPSLEAWLGSLTVELCISVVTLGELQFGASSVAERRPRLAATLEAWIGELVATSHIVPMDAAAARVLGRLQAIPALRHLATPASGLSRFGADLGIAASAIAAGTPLATFNVRDFRLVARHFPGLTVIDPLAAQ